MEKRVLVTGGAGFIGSHLVDAYLDHGWQVAVLDNLSSGDRSAVNPKAEFFHGDIREPGRVLEAFRPSTVNHHAAQINVRASVENPAADAHANVVGSVTLLQSCVDAGVRRFIFASSGAVYGEPLTAPQTETHPLRPISPYGCAKLAVEHYLNYFLEVRGLSCAALRYANVYGPRQKPDGENGVLAIFADRLLRDKDVLINGSGQQTRDFVFVEDVVQANLHASEHPELVGAFNVGTGVETTVLALYDGVCRAVGTARRARLGPAKTGEQFRSVLRTSRAGWLSPGIDLLSGIEKTTGYLRNAMRSQTPSQAD